VHNRSQLLNAPHRTIFKELTLLANETGRGCSFQYVKVQIMRLLSDYGGDQTGYPPKVYLHLKMLSVLWVAAHTKCCYLNWRDCEMNQSI